MSRRQQFLASLKLVEGVMIDTIEEEKKWWRGE